MLRFPSEIGACPRLRVPASAGLREVFNLTAGTLAELALTLAGAPNSRSGSTGGAAKTAAMARLSL
jgi:hypothetical protein